MSKKSRGTRVPAHKRPRYAHWVLRAGAYLIDVGLVLLLLFAADRAEQLPAGEIVAALLIVANRWLAGGRTGQTLGRRALRLRLQSADTGEPIGFWRALLRDLAHVFDTAAVCAGWFYPIWDRERQTFADKIMRTHVVLLR